MNNLEIMPVINQGVDLTLHERVRESITTKKKIIDDKTPQEIKVKEKVNLEFSPPALRIEELYATIKDIDEPEKRETVREGINIAVGKLIKHTQQKEELLTYFKTEDKPKYSEEEYYKKFFKDQEEAHSFFKKTAQLKYSDPKYFAQLFEETQKIDKEGYNLDKWLHTFSSLTDTKQLKSFLDESRQIIADEQYDQYTNQVLDEFLNNISNIKQYKHTLLNKYFQNLAGVDLIDDKKNTIEQFSKQYLLIN